MSITVRTKHQDRVEANANRITVIDPGPIFCYTMHGCSHVNREPLARVRLRMNDGDWDGVARTGDLEAAGLLQEANTVLAAPMLVTPLKLPPMPAGAR